MASWRRSGSGSGLRAPPWFESCIFVSRGWVGELLSVGGLNPHLFPRVGLGLAQDPLSRAVRTASSAESAAQRVGLHSSPRRGSESASSSASHPASQSLDDRLRRDSGARPLPLRSVAWPVYHPHQEDRRRWQPAEVWHGDAHVVAVAECSRSAVLPSGEPVRLGHRERAPVGRREHGVDLASSSYITHVLVGAGIIDEFIITPSLLVTAWWMS